MNGRVLERLLKPAYVLRPQQAVLRLRDRSGVSVVRTPWGSELCVAADALGKELRKSAVHELAVTELMWRVVQPGDIVVDAGANLGYFATLLAARVGDSGRVVAIEAHPEVAAVLKDNVRRNNATAVTVISAALSDRQGTVRLSVSDDLRSDTTGSEVVASGGIDCPA
jgi:hypothetical protein